MKPSTNGVKTLQGVFVAYTPTWEGPGRPDYPAAMADLRDYLGGKRDRRDKRGLRERRKSRLWARLAR
jgi:hypothetical protein